MSDKKTLNENPTLEKAIDAVLQAMQNHTPDSSEYERMVNQLDKLYKMRTYKKASAVEFNTLISAGASLVGIIMILGYEHADVITSKALGFVTKTKI